MKSSLTAQLTLPQRALGGASHLGAQRRLILVTYGVDGLQPGLYPTTFSFVGLRLFRRQAFTLLKRQGRLAFIELRIDFFTVLLVVWTKSTHRGDRTRDHEIKSLARYRLS